MSNSPESRFFRSHFRRDCKIKVLYFDCKIKVIIRSPFEASESGAKLVLKKFQITESRIFLFSANILEIEMCRLENSFGAHKFDAFPDKVQAKSTPVFA